MRIRKTRQSQRLAFSAGLGAALLMTGCLVTPLPGTKQIQGAAGAPEKKRVDLTFLKTGQTSRNEVLQKLGWANAGIKSDKLFLGRWISSHEWIWFAAGYYSAAGGSGRVKEKMHNLLVQFDERSMVRQVRKVPDGRLVQEFRTWIVEEQEPPLELSSAVDVEIMHHHATDNQFEPAGLTLTKDSFVFHEFGNTKHDFRIAPEKIAGMTTVGAFSRPGDPSYMGETIHFSEKTAAGGKITFQIAASDLFVLVKYLQQVRPAAFPKTKDKVATLGARSTKTSIQ